MPAWANVFVCGMCKCLLLGLFSKLSGNPTYWLYSHSICGLWWIVEYSDVGQTRTRWSLLAWELMANSEEKLFRLFSFSDSIDFSRFMRRSCWYSKLSFPHSFPTQFLIWSQAVGFWYSPWGSIPNSSVILNEEFFMGHLEVQGDILDHSNQLKQGTEMMTIVLHEQSVM